AHLLSTLFPYTTLFRSFLVGIGQFRAGPDEILVITLQEIGGLGIEAECVAIVVKLLDAREQFAVEMDGVAVGRQLWRHFFVDFLQRGIGVAGVEIGERALGA